VEVLIEMKARAGACPGCAGLSTRVHERTDVRLRDIAAHGKPTYLVWHKRRFRCEQPE
jgi:transposase